MIKKFLQWIITLATNYRKIIYIITIIMIIGLGAAASLIKMDTRWTVFLPNHMPIVKEYRKIDNNYIMPNNMIVAISCNDHVKLEQITDNAVEILEREMLSTPGMSIDEIKKKGRYAKYVYGKFPEEWLNRYSFRLLKPKDARRIRDIYSDPQLLSYLTHINDDFEREYTDSENVKNQEQEIVASLDGLQRLIQTINKAASKSIDPETIKRTVRDQTIGRPYSFSLDNTMSLILVASSVPSDDMDAIVKMDYRVEALLKPLAQKYPEAKIERTGAIPISRDEMDSMGGYTIVLTLVAFVLIFILLAWNFKSLLVPALAMVPIVTGIIWTMGFIGLTLKEMNLITSMMMVVLLGLGIDYTIHLCTRFQEEIQKGKTIGETLHATIAGTGKGVITGALTTTIAFMALMIADAKAIFEFGFCAGAGVFFTLVATIWLLPSLLASRVKILEKAGKKRRKINDFSVFGSIAQIMAKNRKKVIIIFSIITLAGFISSQYLEWEWNYLNLEPANLRSVELQDEIVDKYKLAPTTSMVTVQTIEESRALHKELKSKRVVGNISDLSMYVSRPDFDETKQFIHELSRSVVIKKPYLSFLNQENREKLGNELDRLWANLVEIQALSITGGQDRIVEKTAQIIAKRENREQGMLRKTADRFINGSVDWNQFDIFSRDFSEKLHKKIVLMSSGDKPVTADMVPEKIRAQFTSKSQDAYLMHIIPNKNLFTKPDLELFQNVVSKSAPKVTGFPQLMLIMNRTTLEEGRIAMLAAIVVILFLLLLDLRRPVSAVLTFLPLATGLSITLGTMWIFSEKLNYINMIALPVIIGIGVDYGVHFIHRFIEEGKAGLKRSIISVGRAILMTTLTTMIGFGSLMFYMMRGMASMGFVLFIGVGWCFITTITLLPALLHIFENKILKKKENSNV